MFRPGRYLLTLGATFVVLCLLAIGLTVAVDPFYIVGTTLASGWNRTKPVAGNFAAAAKTYLLERSEPRTLLIGNSRIEVGFDPQSPQWPADMRPVFNGGVAGRNLAVSAKLLEDALASPGLRHVLVGVEFLDFLEVVRPGPRRPEQPCWTDTVPDRERVRVLSDLSPNPDRIFGRIRDLITASLTLDAVTGSVATLLAQHQLGAATMTPLGFNPLDEYRVYTRDHGFHDLFQQKQEQYSARFAHYTHPDFAELYRSCDFQYLREIMTTALARDLDTTLIIFPYHAWVLDLIRQDGLWNSFEAWKQALVRVMTELDPSHRIRLVDFSGYDAQSTEPVPASGDTRTVMRWYWEPGHFRPALGDRIIQRLYGDGDKGFGRDLTPSSLPGVLASIREEAARADAIPSRN